MNKDKELRQRASKVIPGGMYGHQNVSAYSPLIPQFFEKAQGARLWDTNGKEYIDYLCAYGPSLFGYAHEAIDAAAIAQLKKGDTMTGPSPIIVDLAEKLVSMISHADWAIFCKNGNDATNMAAQCARSYSNRRKVLIATGAYHGASPWCSPFSVGITAEEKANTLYFAYNDIQSLAEMLNKHKGDVAAVFATPFRHDVFADQEEPTAEYAQAVRLLCDEHDALLVVDEIRTGFRLNRGSSWDALGVKPDLSTWGKALGNGHPISALVGNDKARTAASEMFATGSYWYSAAPMAAALKTLELIQNTDYLETTVTLGNLLRKGIAKQAEQYDFDLRQTGPVQMPQMLFADDKELVLGKAWTTSLIEQGIYFHPYHNMFLNAAMTTTDIELTLEATEVAFSKLRNNTK